MLIRTPFLTDREIAMEAERRELEKRSLDMTGEATKKKMDVLPSVFAESVYTLDGRPFRLNLRDYLRPIYDWPISDGLLMTGRQVEKSSTFSVKISNTTLGRSFCRSLYFAPQNSQVEVFSTDRLGRLFIYSQEDIIKREYLSKHDKQNVHNKSFANGSLIYLRHCYDMADNIRGLSVNCLFGDEIQDINVDAIPVIQETQAHARDLGPGIRENWFAGTPKTFSNTIQQLWDTSDQREWVVRCLCCGKDQILGVANLTPNAYICTKCGNALTPENIAHNARWVPMKPGETTTGFRISQMMNPAMLPSDIWQKMNRYPKGKFFNEVLGRSYENADRPFPMSLLEAITKSNISMYEYRFGEFSNVDTFMGIDWGHGTKSFTVITIGAFNSNGEFQVLYTRIFKMGEELDTEYQLREVFRLMEAFNVRYCIADYGDGFQHGRRLKDRFGPRFDMCYYADRASALHQYNQEGFFWVVRRTDSLTEYVEAVQKYQVIWPGADRERMQHLIDHHVVEQVEYQTPKSKSESGNLLMLRSSRMVYTHPISKPDDGFHSAFYAWFAAKMVRDGHIASITSYASSFAGVSF